MSDPDRPVDQLLREAHRSAPPALSPGFDRRLRRRIAQAAPRRLTRSGRLLLSLYALLAAAICIWRLALLRWNWDWIPASFVEPALWAAVPFTFWLALSLPRWLRRLRAG